MSQLDLTNKCCRGRDTSLKMGGGRGGCVGLMTHYHVSIMTCMYVDDSKIKVFMHILNGVLQCLYRMANTRIATGWEVRRMHNLGTYVLAKV